MAGCQLPVPVHVREVNTGCHYLNADAFLQLIATCESTFCSPVQYCMQFYPWRLCLNSPFGIKPRYPSASQFWITNELALYSLVHVTFFKLQARLFLNYARPPHINSRITRTFRIKDISNATVNFASRLSNFIVASLIKFSIHEFEPWAQIWRAYVCIGIRANTYAL